MVYPTSANFPTLNKSCSKVGRIWTVVAADGTVGNGSFCSLMAVIFDPSGRRTCMVDVLFVGMKSLSGRPKWDVAPESTIIVLRVEVCFDDMSLSRWSAHGMVCSFVSNSEDSGAQ